MNILISTLFNLNETCAGLNRVYKFSDALAPHGINCFIAGSGCSKGDWTFEEDKEFKKILFNRKKFSSIRHSNTMNYAAEASKFYRNYLKDISNQFHIDGVLIYSPQGEVVGPIIRISREIGIFVLADCGEYYHLSAHYLFNGMIFQQVIFKYLQMKKLDGVIVPSPIWYQRAEKLNLHRVLIPGISDKEKYRKHPSVRKKISIVFMGRFLTREMPNVIFKALSICKQRRIPFSFNVIGSKNKGYEERFWLKKLKDYKDLTDVTHLNGYISDKDRDTTLSEADIFIMLRPKNIETEHLFPSRVPEYLLSGNPVILSNTEPLNFFFKDGHGVKFISKKNNPLELANLIEELANSPSYRFNLGRRGREYAISNFSSRKMGLSLAEFLNSIKDNNSS